VDIERTHADTDALADIAQCRVVHPLVQHAIQGCALDQISLTLHIGFVTLGHDGSFLAVR
jgi:hypothetical protein